MSLHKRIAPTNRIREQINLRDLVEKHGLAVPIEHSFQKDEDDISSFPALAISANIYAFSGHDLSNLVDEVVLFTYEETFKLLKRKINSMKDDDAL